MITIYKDKPTIVTAWFSLLSEYLSHGLPDQAVNLIQGTNGVSKKLTDPETGATIAHYAARRHALSVLRLIHEKGFNLDRIDKEGKTPLMWALQKYSESNTTGETVRFLVEKGNVNINRVTECHSAINLAYKAGQIDTMKYLIKKGGSIKLNEAKGWIPSWDFRCSRYRESVASEFFRDVEAVKLVVESMGDLRDSRILHGAAEYGRMAPLRYLVEEKKADLECCDCHGETPLFYASNEGHLDAIRYLVSKGANLEPVTKYSSQTVLGEAISRGDWRVAKCLVECGANVNTPISKGMRPIHKVCSLEKTPYDFLKLLIRSGADVNSSGPYGATTLHYAVLVKKGMKTTTMLIENGAGINRADDRGSTPLQLATFFAHEEIMEILIQSGADVKQIDKTGRSLLHFVVGDSDLKKFAKDYCCPSDKEVLKTVKYLVGKGTNILAANNDVKSVIEYTANNKDLKETHAYLQNEQMHRNQKLIRHLVEASWFSRPRSALKRKSANGDPEAVRSLASQGAKFENLLSAIRQHDLETAKRLVESGANVNNQDNSGKTALHHTMRADRRLDCSFATSLDAVKFLVANGANVNQADNEGRTVLHYATLWKYPHIVKFLLMKGATIDQRDVKGFTALQYATFYAYSTIVSHLIGNGADIRQIDNKNGRTLLHFAVGACDPLDSMKRIPDLRHSFIRDGGRRRSEEEDEEKLRTVKNLVEQGANILATDAYGNTVIDYTASGGGKIHAYLQGELIRRNQKLIRHLVEADWFGPCCTTSVKRKHCSA